MGRGVWSRRCEAKDLHGSVIASSGEVLVCRIKCDTLDKTLVVRNRLELLEGVPRPDNDFRIQADGDQNGGVVGPAEVLDIIVVRDQSAKDAPVLDWRCLVRTYLRQPTRNSP